MSLEQQILIRLLTTEESRLTIELGKFCSHCNHSEVLRNEKDAVQAMLYRVTEKEGSIK